MGAENILHEKLRNADSLLQLGKYIEADKIYREAAALDLGNSEALAGLLYLKRQSAIDNGDAAGTTYWNLIWQTSKSELFGVDWLEYILGDVAHNEIIDQKYSTISKNMIIVDSSLNKDKLPYYAQAYGMGCRIVLFHLSDESYSENCEAYKYCNLVVRGYWSFRYENNRKVITIPIGYRNGFANSSSAPPVARKHVWSFAGDVKKSTRGAMLEAMRRFAPGFEHLTRGFTTNGYYLGDALPSEDYRRLMDESIFVPCPTGWVNLDSFRVWEALEAGCVPIVERRGSFDYFKCLLGEHPLPTLSDWSECDALLGHNPEEWERLRQTCQTWWASYKPRVRQLVGSVFHQAATWR